MAALSPLLRVVWGFRGLKQRPQNVHGAEAETENKRDAKCYGYETDKGQCHSGVGIKRKDFVVAYPVPTGYGF